MTGGGTTYADASGNANTATPHGSVSTAASGPLGSTGISLTGAAGTYLSTAKTYNDPGAMTEVAWFKAPTSGYGGSIIGFTTKQLNTTPSMWDRMIWMDSTGHLVYGIYPGGFHEVSSGTHTYANGQWHMVVASYGAGGQQLWVDGLEVGSNAAVTTAQNYTGWWHVGHSHATTSWSDPPSRADW